MPAVSILKLQPLDHEALPPALVEAITDEFLVDTGAPAFPIRLQPDLPLDGQCMPPETTEEYEVVIDLDNAHYCDPVTLRCIYLHEVSHRLMGWKYDSPHDARFATLYLVFLLRCGYHLRFSLYDMQNEQAGALGWCWQLATELADTRLDGWDCTTEIQKRYDQTIEENKRAERKVQIRKNIKAAAAVVVATVAILTGCVFSITK